MSLIVHEVTKLRGAHDWTCVGDPYCMRCKKPYVVDGSAPVRMLSTVNGCYFTSAKPCKCGAANMVQRIEAFTE